MFPLFSYLAYPLTFQPEFPNLFLQVPVPSLFQVKRGRQKLSQYKPKCWWNIFGRIFQKRVQAFWKEVKINFSNLGLSFDWRKHDWKASNSFQSFKIFSSSLGKSWFSATPAAIENESSCPKEQKNRNDDNLGLINRRGFNEKVPERYFHMEAKDSPYPRMHRWRNISQKPFPGCDDPKQNGVHLCEKGKWSSKQKRFSFQHVKLGFFPAWDCIIMEWHACK